MPEQSAATGGKRQPVKKTRGLIKTSPATAAGGFSTVEVTQDTAADLNVTVGNTAANGVYVRPGTSAVFQTQSNSANIATETTVSAINTKLVSGTDIGDVTINNASGANAVNIQDGGNTITVDGTVTATVADGLGVKVYDTGTSAYSGILLATNKEVRVVNQPYLQAIVEGYISGHSNWSKIGYNPALVASTEADIWSKAGAYTFASSAGTWEVISDDGTNLDKATVIKGDATGDTYTSTGGSTTTLIDTAHGATYFTDATSVAVGDCIILDPHGTTPEWGYVTTVAAQTLTVAGGFSSGGTGASRKYAVLDYSSTANAHAFKIEYLDGSYNAKSEIVALTTNGSTATATINTDYFRVNSFRMIDAGSAGKPKGNISLRVSGGATTYSYITAGFTRARNIQYTVPLGKTLYITQWNVGYAYSHNSTHYCRLYTRANREPSTGFLTGSIFFPYTEVVASNSFSTILFEAPTKLAAKTDIKVSALADYAGIVTVALRGWLE